MWDNVEEGAKKQKDCIVHVLLFHYNGFSVTDIDQIQNNCRTNNEASNYVNHMVLETDATWAEQHVEWDEKLKQWYQ